MKRRGLGGSVVVIVSAGMLLLGAQTKSYPQTVTTFTSASAWQAAVQGSSQFTQDFTGFAKDTYFQTSPLIAGPLTLYQIGADPTYGYFQNFIDVPPLQFTDNSGVTNAALFTKSGLITVDMSFTSTVFAWGANFYDAQTGELENLVLIEPGGTVLATVPVTVNTGFFGFVISPSTPITDVVFESQLANPNPTVGQGFGLENVVGACTGTCVPATLVFNPPSVNFGNVTVGSKSSVALVTGTNNSGGPAVFGSASGISEFRFPGGTCYMLSPDTTLAAAATCTFDLQFAPKTPGPANGTITINTVSGPVTFQMSGVGVAAK